MIDVLKEICNRVWRPKGKKGNLQLCQNYKAISRINHPSKAMLKIILNRLKPQAEETIVKEQAGFRAGRSITEHIQP